MSEIDIKSPARYRLQIILNRDLVCPPDGLDEVVAFELTKLAELGYTCVAHHVNKLKDRPQKKRIGEFTVDDVLPFITSSESKKDYVVNGQAYSVRMNSQRYFVFRDSLSCVSCGIVGTKMILEQHPGDKSAHFNLYAEEDGNLVLMTKDHILAKSVGGEDRHSNYQTMCSICNNIKASDAIDLEDLRTLRMIYNRNIRQLTKKQLYRVVEDAKIAMVRSKVSQNCWHDTHVTLHDMSLYDVGTNDLEAVTMYSNGRGTHVGCISKGTPISGQQVGDWLYAELTDGTRVHVPIKLVRPWETREEVSECKESTLQDRSHSLY